MEIESPDQRWKHVYVRVSYLNRASFQQEASAEIIAEERFVPSNRYEDVSVAQRKSFAIESFPRLRPKGRRTLTVVYADRVESI